MMPRIATTPPADGGRPGPAKGSPRAVSADVLAAVLPGPGRDRLAAGPTLAVTTGQQPGLFTGPLYTIYKALSAAALARRLERERKTPVVPVFWVAGDDHDFAEANHAWVLDAGGQPVRVALRDRPAGGPLLPLYREPCGSEIDAALARLAAALPDTEFKADVLAWLRGAYRTDTNLADAFADALNVLLAELGIAVFRAHDPAAKRAAAPWILRGLDVTLPDGLTPVLVEGRAGRDRLRPEADGSFVTRRGEERFTREDLEGIASREPERLSPNVLLRPVVEAALFPTVAYAAGPGELEYLPDAAALYQQLGVAPQAPVPRWSGTLVDGRAQKLMEKHGLTLADFERPAGALDAHVVSESLSPEIGEALAGARRRIEEDYGRLGAAVARLDPTLERTVTSARNAALAGTQEIERKLVASLKRANETLLTQVGKARAALAPEGKPQERVFTAASFLVRYGRGLLDEIAVEVARWADAP